MNIRIVHRHFSTIVFALACLLMGMLNANAALILVKPTGAEASQSNGTFTATQAINGSGFTVTEQALLETNDPVPGSGLWPDHEIMNPNWELAWRSNYHNDDGSGGPIAVDHWIELDLGGAYSVSGLHFWNYMEGGSGNYDRGADVINILLSTDGGTTFDITVASNRNVDRLSEDANAIYGETIDFGGTYAGVNAVLIEVTQAVDYTGVGEVRMIAFIPEPGTLTLALASLSLLGVRRRRR